jgi:hypothetical protein
VGNGDTTDPNFSLLGKVYEETRKTGEHVAVMGERLVRVETKVDHLTPKVEQACRKANSAKVSVAELRGEKTGKEKGLDKIMRYVWPVVIALVGGGVTLLVSFLVGG